MERQELRVLLVEDNLSDAEIIELEIERSDGFDLIMERVETETEVRNALHRRTFDVIICDFNLPKLDAIKVLDILDEFSLDTPFVLVSGKISDEQADRLLGRRRIHEYVNKNQLSRLGPVFRRQLMIASTYDVTLQAWARALEFRDRDTEGHSQRVTELAVRFARKLKISETEIIHIRRGALLHDIGKMGVSDNVLLKPDRLTAEEFERMKKHTQIGYDLIWPIPYLRKSVDIPYCHHEKWDGSGYPRGLKGIEIPLAARVFSIVDVYDALTNDRPYRKAMTREYALSYIEKQKGIAFDPAIAPVFIEMMIAEGGNGHG